MNMFHVIVHFYMPENLNHFFDTEYLSICRENVKKGVKGRHIILWNLKFSNNQPANLDHRTQRSYNEIN